MGAFLGWTSQDLKALCVHVEQHGPSDWQQVAEQLGWSPTLCVLKWHTLSCQHDKHQQLACRSRRYSDWEMCILYVGDKMAHWARTSKKEMYEGLAAWLPGRTAEGVKQAINAHVVGHEQKLIAKLICTGLPSSLPELLEAWPHVQEVQAAFSAADSEHRDIARQLLISLAAAPSRSPRSERSPARGCPSPVQRSVSTNIPVFQQVGMWNGSGVRVPLRSLSAFGAAEPGEFALPQQQAQQVLQDAPLPAAAEGGGLIHELTSQQPPSKLRRCGASGPSDAVAAAAATAEAGEDLQPAAAAAAQGWPAMLPQTLPLAQQQQQPSLLQQLQQRRLGQNQLHAPVVHQAVAPLQLELELQQQLLPMHVLSGSAVGGSTAQAHHPDWQQVAQAEQHQQVYGQQQGYMQMMHDALLEGHAAAIAEGAGGAALTTDPLPDPWVPALDSIASCTMLPTVDEALATSIGSLELLSCQQQQHHHHHPAACDASQQGSQPSEQLQLPAVLDLSQRITEYEALMQARFKAAWLAQTVAQVVSGPGTVPAAAGQAAGEQQAAGASAGWATTTTGAEWLHGCQCGCEGLPGLDDGAAIA